MEGKSKKGAAVHRGRTLDELIAEHKAKDPVFAAEFDRLQLARRIRELRQKRKLSQAQLARKVGTAQPNIARLESGRVIPKLDLLAKVARALGTRLQVQLTDS